MGEASVSVLERIARRHIVPVVVLDDEKLSEPLAETLLRAGLDVMEITFRTAAAVQCIRRIAERFPEMLLGAGTLLDADQVRRAAESGARFAVAPGLNPRVVESARQAGLEMVPGVMTPSEVENALSMSCRTLKFFPAEQAGGVAMLKALEGPYSHTGVRFIPTGGINMSNMQSYLERPSVVAIGGSWMVEKRLIAAGDWRRIEDLTVAAVASAAIQTQQGFTGV
ncbi:MAG: bifunctional 4-hydroxy-2-oxoglutarate aldolase/2-dehydro-3-deoxy-phosphogluconate aldolase [Acidobacteriia bacterium]|nr:bifunctional 4-hydroxy-2-oxoglutarate aldolase/2-dehydro-3-deoxy-phosphogluconate aldolase [Terriglobia bacterium]